MAEGKLQPYLFCICIISAEGLSKGNSYYVTVSIKGDDQISKQITPINDEGLNNPKWNHEMTFMVKQISVQRNLLSVVLKIHDKGSLFNKCVGEVRIPMKEMIGDNKLVDVVTFQLKKSKYIMRKPKGEIKISYEVMQFAASQLITAKNHELVAAFPDLVSVETVSVTAESQELATSSFVQPPIIDTGSSYSLPGTRKLLLFLLATAAYTSQADRVPVTDYTSQAAPVTTIAAYTQQTAPITALVAYAPQADPATAPVPYAPQADPVTVSPATAVPAVATTEAIV